LKKLLGKRIFRTETAERTLKMKWVVWSTLIGQISSRGRNNVNPASASAAVATNTISSRYLR